MRPLRIVLVDDHEIVRAGVRSELAGDGFDVVAEAGDVDEAVAAIVTARPDVVLLDVHLPGGNGPEVIRRVSDETEVETVFLALNMESAVERRDVFGGPARGRVTDAIAELRGRLQARRDA